MRILLTGGAGSIGSIVAAQLLEAGHEKVVIYDDLSKGNRCAVPPDAEYIEGDVRDVTHLIPIVLQVTGGVRDQVAIFGTDYATPDGTCVRDYIHFSDLVRAHLLALGALAQQSMPAQLIYNVGNGSGFSVRSH